MRERILFPVFGAAVLGLSVWAVPSMGKTCQVYGKAGDSYVLSQGQTVSMNCSTRDLSRLRRTYGRDFLWFRRHGKTYLIRDSAVTARASTLFDGLKALEPERQAIAARERELEAQDRALDREQEVREAAEEAAESVSEAAPARDEAAVRDLESRQRAVESREREVDSVERDLDASEEDIETAAEENLWLMLDDAVRDGSAKPAR